MNYELKKQYMQNDGQRHALNDLAQKIFCFSFETWCKGGYCTEKYHPYTLFDGKKAIANVSANEMLMRWQGKVYNYIQLGTVMTDKEYRKQGLSRFIMETILDEWKDKSDAIILVANKDVLEFYPKFGFEKMDQYKFIMDINNKNITNNIKKLDMDDPRAVELLERYYKKTNPFSKVQVINDFTILMFYTTLFFKDFVYYLEEYDAVVIMEKKRDEVRLYDIYCDADKSMIQLIQAVCSEETRKAVFKFTPIEQTNCKIEKDDDIDSNLFVLKGKQNIFRENQLFFPRISHT